MSDPVREQAKLLDALLATMAATTRETPPNDVRKAFLIIEKEVQREAKEEEEL